MNNLKKTIPTILIIAFMVQILSSFVFAENLPSETISSSASEKSTDDKLAFPQLEQNSVSKVIFAIAAWVENEYYLLYMRNSDYVGTVATEKITKDEFIFFAMCNKCNMEIEAQLVDDNSKANYWRDKSKVEILKNATLKQIVDVKIQLAKAREKNVTALNKENLTKLQTFKTTELKKYHNNKFEADKAIKRSYGVDFGSFIFICWELLLRQQFQDQYTFSDSDCQKYYNANKQKYDMATVGSIFFSASVTDSKEKQDAAKKKAEDTFKKAKAGQNFKKLAKTLSEDPLTKDNGGIYEFQKGLMVKEFEDWAFDSSRKPGDIGMIKTSDGYDVIKFHKRVIRPFDDIKNSIESDLYEKELGQWKNDPKYNFIKNDTIYNSINIIS
ncbi:MAG TPA: peptidylprolyl isomerase [Clostridia bacterium]